MAYDVTGLNAYTKEFVDVLYFNCIAQGVTLPYLRANGAITLDMVKQTGSIPVADVDETTILQGGQACVSSAAGDIDLTNVNVTVGEYTLLMQLCAKDFHGTSAELTLPAGSDYDTLGSWESQLLGLIVRKIGSRYETLAWQSDTAGAGDLAEMDGFEKQISDAVTALTIPAAQAHALSTAKVDILATVDTMIDSIPTACLNDPNYSEGNLAIFMTKKTALTYTQAYKAAFSDATYTTGANRYLIEDATGAPIVGVPGISADNIIVIALVPNMIVAADVAGEESSIMLEKGVGSEHNQFFVHGASKLGVGFKDLTQLVVNNL